MITPADISPETNEADVKAEKVQIQNSGPMLVEALSSADRSAPAQAAPASDDDGQSEEESFPPEHMAMASLKTWGDLPGEIRRRMRRDVTLDCGWGRLIFGQTFDDAQTLAEALREEDPGRRDIAIYLRDPQVVLAMAPQELFLDPSHTYRLYLEKPMPDWTQPQGFFVRPVETLSDADAIDRIYRSRNMVPPYEGFVWRSRLSSIITYLVAEDTLTGDIVGVVTGVDHKNAFNDPDNGSSLWALAVDTQCPHAGVGEALTRVLANHFRARGRDFMDLSVVHDNAMAIKLYEKLGFVQVPAFALKNKNGINEKLFVGPQVTAKLNPYATLLVNEARRRGIAVQVDDAEGGFFTLSLGGRTISCRESLTDLTSAVALSRCDDKAVTRRLLDAAGLQVPGQTKVELDSSPEEIKAFLKRYRRVVVKPARGEQGRGISVDLRDDKSVRSAIEAARQHCDQVLMEEFCAGEDLRMVVIDFKLVAAAVRRPASIAGDGHNTIATLIEKQSRRRAAATGGESTIPVDAETERVIAAAGYGFEDVLPEGEVLVVRKTANLHTGGTIHDVTDRVHRSLVEAAVKAAQILDIPVVGLDFLCPNITEPDYVIIEANERPGLANHEPQPTAERFIDLLFPQTKLASGVEVRR